MLNLPPVVQIYCCRQPTDMRRGFDGLSHAVMSLGWPDPAEGAFYVFRNRRGDRLKILYWDQDGFVLWYKRLEKGTFRLPEGDSDRIDRQELLLLLEGLDRRMFRRRIRYKK